MSVCQKPALQEFDRSLCTIWVTNGIANSSYHLLCTLIMSWFEGSHRPFQTLTYFPSLTFWRGQRRLTCPLFHRWENWDQNKDGEFSTKVIQQADVLIVQLLLLVDSPEPIQRHTFKYIFRWWLPANWFLLFYLSQTMFKTTQMYVAKVTSSDHGTKRGMNNCTCKNKTY